MSDPNTDRDRLADEAMTVHLGAQQRKEQPARTNLAGVGVKRGDLSVRTIQIRADGRGDFRGAQPHLA